MLAGLDHDLTAQDYRSCVARHHFARGGFRREVQPRRQNWFLNEKSGFPFQTPAFCSVSRGQRRLGEKEYRAPSVTPGVALRVTELRLSLLVTMSRTKTEPITPPNCNARAGGTGRRCWP